MIFRAQDMKYIVGDIDGNSFFKDNGKATKKELKKALELDAEYVKASGKHYFSNYKEIESRLKG